jgi:hypothetical protein
MGSATANKRGIDVLTTTGSFTVKGCSFYSFQASSFGMLCNQVANANITIDDIVMYSMANIGLQISAVTSSTVSITNSFFFSASTTFTMENGTISGITTTGGATPFNFNGLVSGGITISNITSHSNSAAGISIGSNSFVAIPFSNLTAWRNTTRGIFISGASNISLDTVVAFGNVTAGIDITTSVLVSIKNATLNGGTTLVQPIGIQLNSSSLQVFVDNSSFGATTAHTTGDISIVARQWHDAIFNNCIFGSTTEIASQTNLAVNAFIGSSKHDQTIKTHKTWKKFGTVTYDSVISASPSSSQRMTPNSATSKVYTTDKTFSIPSGKTANVTVGVRRSVVGDGTAYNGSLPRLWLRSNNSAGISTDTLLATATAASSGAFEYITGSIPAADDNTINTLYIDLDGTTGWVNVDAWKLDIINGSANSTNINLEGFWNDGKSFPTVNTTLVNNSGTETYWINGFPTEELFQISSIQTGRFFLVFDEA